MIPTKEEQEKIDKEFNEWKSSKTGLGVSDHCSKCTDGHYGLQFKKAMLFDDKLMKGMAVNVQVCDICKHLRLFLS